MQAGVPIVPIVIHNAIDVAPRGQYVFRAATVKISVLPAVDTSHWSALTMNQHVHDVRDMFLEALDQMQYQIDDEGGQNKTKPPVEKAAKTAVIKKKTKTLTTSKSAIKSSKATVKKSKETSVKRKLKVVEPKRASRKRPRKKSALKVSARVLKEAESSGSISHEKSDN
jgi:putative phosphoserine phosphatase/1-acylglycerol-3-phosphate O-acyltransferase